MAKKTNDEFIKELKKKNQNVKPLEEYNGATTKIRVRCRICGHEWKATPNGLLSKKTGCPKCAGTYKMTHEEFMNELSFINPNVILIGKYTRRCDKIQVKCSLCENVWFPIAGNLLRGHGCKSCSSPIKKTHKQFIEEVKENNPYVEIIGKYIGVEYPIDVKCLICGENYTTHPHVVLNGGVHKPCVRKVKEIPKPKSKSHDVFIKEVDDLGKNVEILSEYINQKTKILTKCKICGLERWALPQSILRNTGTGCPICSEQEAKIKMRSSHETFLEKLHGINPHINVLDAYIDNRTKIRIQCKNCGHIEYVSPDKLLSRIYNCKACSDYTSFPNRFMTSVLDELHINYTPEKVFDWSNNKRYDFYLPDYNTIIEMHGEQHYKKDLYDTTVKQQEKNDKYKYDLACTNGISNYIVIDSRKSSFDYIWNNLLNEVFFNDKLSFIDKQTVLERCVSTSKIVELSRYYNNGITKNVDLQRCLGVSKGTVTSYKRKAIACNLIKVS